MGPLWQDDGELRCFIGATMAGEKKKEKNNGNFIARVDAIFVPGTAGIGKLCFVRHTTKELLRSRGDCNDDGMMIVLEEKLQEILSSLFGRLVTDLVSMRDGKGG